MTNHVITPMLERIRGRCKVEDGCWIWTGAVSTSRNHKKPVMNVNDKTVAVRRIVAQEIGLDVSVKRASLNCGNHLCVSPYCVVSRSQKEVAQRCSDNLQHQKRPSRNVKQRDNKAKKMSIEIAREIRASELSTADLAAAHGISLSHVCNIRRHACWKEYTGNPFAGLGARK